MFLQSEEFDRYHQNLSLSIFEIKRSGLVIFSVANDFLLWCSWGLDEAFSGYYDSSSPDGAASSAASKNIVSERNRRKKLNERLFALRAVVPNISKVIST